jgi:tetrahydromethanopterin S-methyltransferase subunit H
MMKFLNEQKVFKISGIELGGQPGKKRTVMVGSIGYPRHSIVEDRVEGRCRPGAFEKCLEGFNHAALETQTPTALMLFAETPQAMRAYLQMAADLTTAPLLIDSPSAEVRLAGVKHAEEMGIGSRVIYNSIHAGTTTDELGQLQDSKVECAVLLAFNPGDIGLKGKIYLLEDGGKLLPSGMIELARGYGITKPLLDTAVMTADQMAGSALRAIVIAKAKWGLPTGCAMHNAVDSYIQKVDLKEDEKGIYRYVDCSAATLPISAGADFVMYGPIEYSRRIFHTSAFADEMMSQAVLDL